MIGTFSHSIRKTKSLAIKAVKILTVWALPPPRPGVGLASTKAQCGLRLLQGPVRALPPPRPGA